MFVRGDGIGFNQSADEFAIPSLMAAKYFLIMSR
jgi:hypothetical protein